MRAPDRLSGLAADVCEDARGDALGRTPALVLVHLVADAQVEEGQSCRPAREEWQTLQLRFLWFRSASVRGMSTTCAVQDSSSREPGRPLPSVRPASACPLTWPTAR